MYTIDDLNFELANIGPTKCKPLRYGATINTKYINFPSSNSKNLNKRKLIDNILRAANNIKRLSC